ncbi:hypothetical protein JCM10213_005920 [Rhodosporidiobolus nylandii]
MCRGIPSSPSFDHPCTLCTFALGLYTGVALLAASSSSPSSSASSRSTTPPSSLESTPRSTTPSSLSYTPSPPPLESPYAGSAALSPLDEDDFPSAPPKPRALPFCAEEEQQYLDLVREVIAHGEDRPTVKNGVGAKALFAPPPLRFSLSRPTSAFSDEHTLLLPLLTTKKMNFDLIAKELVWMLSGSTSSDELAAQGCRVWDVFGRREYLDGRGLQGNAQGDLGPVYGFQWRHFGAEYEGVEKDYSGKGVDQLVEVIKQIKAEPEKRRKVLCAWNPADLDKMGLPPCPILCQFYVHSPVPTLFGQPGKPRLSCLVYQRSADLGLGLPWDLCTYALLTHTLAHLTSTVPHQLTYQLGDAHVYSDHIEPLKPQLARVPRGWAELKWRRSREELEYEGGVDAVGLDDWDLSGYEGAAPVRLKLHP